MNDAERYWWAVLCQVDTLLEIANRQGDTERFLLWHNVSIQARQVLRDEFKVNLDNLFEEAKCKALLLFDQEVEKTKVAKRQMQMVDELLLKIKTALGENNGTNS